MMILYFLMRSLQSFKVSAHLIMNFMYIYHVCMGMYICMYLHMYIHMYAHVCHNYIVTSNQHVYRVQTCTIAQTTRVLRCRPLFYYRGNALMAVRYGLYKAHLWTWATPEHLLKTVGVIFILGIMLSLSCHWNNYVT